MRIVTFASKSEQLPGLVASDGRIVDLRKAFALARDLGSIDRDVDPPQRVLDIISKGESMQLACAAILRDAEAGALETACMSASQVSLLAPIPRPLKNVFCVGSNYRAHVAEASRAQNKEDKVPDYPVFFTKPPTAVVGPGAAIRLDSKLSQKMDYAVELGVIIGKPGRDIRAADAVKHIFGFTIINDITARDVQRRHGGQFLKGKGLDTTCPMGPHIVTLDELPGFDSLRISLKVNDQLRQDGNTSSMMFSIPKLLESLSEGMTLEPGDILATGTPSGVGYAMDPPCFLKDGDRVSCEIEGIGQLQNTIREASSEANAA